jgi:transcriptional regulator with XRE-family HTH domain
LSDLRWRAGLSRAAVAARAGVSKDLLQSLEQGRTANPTLRVLAGLARGLNVSVGELLAGLDFASPGTGKEWLQSAAAK